LCSVLRPRQHSIGYMGDGFYRSKDPTNSIKVLKEMLQRKMQGLLLAFNTVTCLPCTSHSNQPHRRSGLATLPSVGAIP